MSAFPVIAYYRVSTQKQGRSGLGLDAQRRAVLEFVGSGPRNLLHEFVEIESGRRKDRPELRAALEMCKRKGATLVIAKLDRLARNVAFIATLLEGRTKFVCCDMPEADSTMLQIYAAFAEREADRISERTKVALAAAKARGTLLGWSMPSRINEQEVAAQRGAATNRDRAVLFARNILPVIEGIRATGIKSLDALASALNARGVATARGGRWHAATVQRVLRAAKSDNVIELRWSC